MDRGIVYPGSIPLDTDLLSANRNAMLAVGALAQATLGTGVVADGLACSPTAPASMSVVIGPGSITSYGAVDAQAYGSLPADTTDSLVKMGVNLATTSFTLSAPGGTGQAINYLIEAAFAETDTTPVVLPYYNAANPAQPYSGPANAGTAQNTQRVQRVQLRLVAGTAATSGSQLTPSPDAGWVGLWVVTVLSSMTSIGGGTIAAYPGGPILAWKLPQLTPGHSFMAVINASQSWVPPAGTRIVKVRLVGGGGGGGAGGGGAGGGGAAGGYAEGYVNVTAGVAVSCTVGAGGASAAAGGTTSFGGAMSATGGAQGSGGSTNGGGAGGAAGAASGTGLLLAGRAGQAGFASSSLILSGAGGASGFGDGATGLALAGTANATGTNAVMPGAGGGGGGGTGAGGTGGAGVIVLEF